MEGVKEIWQENDRTLAIVWTDHKQGMYDVVRLRELCPCAGCVDEMSGLRKQEMGKKDFSKVRPTKIQSVGAYALRIDFSDGHKTGIYSFDYLRTLSS